MKKEEDDQEAKQTDGKDQDKEKDVKKEGKSKPTDAIKKKNLKRAGSPALSESSGNESSRKKLKKSATSGEGSRAGTPLHPAIRKKTGGAGSGSDGEATGGEMSDGAIARKKKKMKAVGSGGKGTPSASRAGSPNPVQGGESTLGRMVLLKSL